MQIQGPRWHLRYLIAMTVALLVLAVSIGSSWNSASAGSHALSQISHSHDGKTGDSSEPVQKTIHHDHFAGVILRLEPGFRPKATTFDAGQPKFRIRQVSITFDRPPDGTMC